MTYLHAALTLLAYTDRPLTVGELTAAAIANGLVRPRGRTPDRSMSSVLYRRMAADPDAPVTCVDGHFWLRGRPPVTPIATALRPPVRHVRRGAPEQRVSRQLEEAGAGRPRRASTLPEPPAIVLPPDVLGAHEVTSSTVRREHAAGRLADDLRRAMGKRAPTATMETWEADRTYRKLVAPLLTLLGYRRVDQQALDPVRGRVSRRLQAGNEQAILLDVLRAGHVLSDGDARATLARLAAAGAGWALLANGHEVRLYSPSLTGALHDPAGALVLRVDLHDLPDDEAYEQAAHMLWLLTRAAVAGGSLDAYLASRAVGATLLAALEDPTSALVDAVTQAVQRTTGLQLSQALVARHARLAVRSERGRDGEPLPADVPAVAAIAGGRSVRPVEQDTARIAS